MKTFIYSAFPGTSLTRCLTVNNHENISILRRVYRLVSNVLDRKLQILIANTCHHKRRFKVFTSSKGCNSSQLVVYYFTVICLIARIHYVLDKFTVNYFFLFCTYRRCLLSILSSVVKLKKQNLSLPIIFFYNLFSLQSTIV